MESNGKMNGIMRRIFLAAYKGESPDLWTTYTYDHHGRVTSVSDASGKKTTHAYDGLSTTVTKEGVWIKKTMDSQGILTSATDAAGTTVFSINAAGEPYHISALDGSSITIDYDKYMRRSSLSDPSLGKTLYEYDSDGNMSRETNADGGITEWAYDTHCRLSKKTVREFTSTYTYTAHNELASVTSTNGYSKAYTYDGLGRVSSLVEKADSILFKRDFAYADGNVANIKYTTSFGIFDSETMVYSNGHLIGGRTLRDGLLFRVTAENSLGQTTGATTGVVKREYEFTSTGIPLKRRAYTGAETIQDVEYTFSPVTRNLVWRKNILTDTKETFGYDNLDRLTSFSGKTVEYSPMGNIVSKSDVGSYGYDFPGRPHAVSSVTMTNDNVDSAEQHISFSSFRLPETIEENGYTAEISYNDDFGRFKTVIRKDGHNVLTRYYFGDCYEYEVNGEAKPFEKLYLFGDYYKAPMMTVRGGNSRASYNLVRDYLGSITAIKLNGTVRGYVNMSYDAWGRCQNPTTLSLYAPGEEPKNITGRGFTGHEHLPYFNLINMNGRLYDPALGRFLSPDPYVQMPESSQNFNRYTYALNNPLKYNDPNGEFFLFTIFNAVTDLLGNIGFHGFNFSHYNWSRTVNAWKLESGMFKGSFGQILNRWTIGFTNSFLGMLSGSVLNSACLVTNVTYLDGMTAVGVKYNMEEKAMTLGSFSLGPKKYKADWRDHMFVHEYGHYIQSQRLGLAYLPVVAIPSVYSAFFTSKLLGIHHSERWFEMNASRLGAKHFDEKYGSGAEGYVPKDPNYFDRWSFEHSRYSPYQNPRYDDLSKYKPGEQGRYYPVSGSKFYVLDVII